MYRITERKKQGETTFHDRMYRATNAHSTVDMNKKSRAFFTSPFRFPKLPQSHPSYLAAHLPPRPSVHDLRVPTAQSWRRARHRPAMLPPPAYPFHPAGDTGACAAPAVADCDDGTGQRHSAAASASGAGVGTGAAPHHTPRASSPPPPPRSSAAKRQHAIDLLPTDRLATPTSRLATPTDAPATSGRPPCRPHVQATSLLEKCTQLLNNAVTPRDAVGYLLRETLPRGCW